MTSPVGYLDQDEGGIWPEGTGRVFLDSIGSTNAHAMAMVYACPGPVWFVAGEQTAGRGRRARPWVSPRGNFHATLLMHPNCPAERAAMRSFVAALALRDALRQLCPTAGLGLKWPNDVLLNGGKVAGILLESSGSGGLSQHLAVGIGVNLIAHPDRSQVEPGALPPVSVLGETGQHLDPATVLNQLGPAFQYWESRFQTEGFAPVRTEFLASAVRLGQTITARIGKDAHEGVFETIDLHGNLILRMRQGQMVIPAADIFF